MEACWLFDVVHAIYLASPRHDRRKWHKILYIMSELTYYAYDSPKKYNAEGVLSTAWFYMKAFRISCRGETATTEMRYQPAKTLIQ